VGSYWRRGSGGGWGELQFFLKESIFLLFFTESSKYPQSGSASDAEHRGGAQASAFAA